MRVLHISTYDRGGGGAGIAASRLMEAMNHIDSIDAKMLVLRKYSDNRNVYSMGDFRGVNFKYLNIVRQKLFNRLFSMLIRPKFPFSYSLSHISHIERVPIVLEADIIYIHWVQSCFLNIKDIYKLLQLGKPIYLFLHDMWSFTGGCHASMGCEKWKTGCKRCPIIQRTFMCSFSHFALQKKIKMWNSCNIHIISPSHWLEECSQKSLLFNNFTIVTIPNTLNDNVFDVMDKKQCRTILNLPQEKRLVLFGASEGTRNIFKGWEYADLLMKRIGGTSELVVFGNSIDNNSVYKVHSIGKLTDEYSMALLYNAVDVYISPTKAEAFGQTIAESISCGTKVVAFNVGGVPDIIRHLDNGYLAERDNVDDLERGVQWVLNFHDDITERERLHENIKSRFSYSVVAKQHADMLNSICVLTS